MENNNSVMHNQRTSGISKAWYPDQGWVVIYDHEYIIQDLLTELKEKGAEKVELYYNRDPELNKKTEKIFSINEALLIC